MTSHVLLGLYPEVLNVNGDAENVSVLARRAGWAGLEARAQRISLGQPLPTARPAVVVLGSGVDAVLSDVSAALRHERERIRDWVAAGTRMLAIGTGFELLADSVHTDAGVLDGLGLVPGASVALPQRVTGELVVDSRYGRLVGFENHARAITFTQVTEALGTIEHGIGEGGGREGIQHGPILGTRMHGPVLALNPSVADALLESVFGEAYRAENDATRRADSVAASARSMVLRSLNR